MKFTMFINVKMPTIINILTLFTLLNHATVADLEFLERGFICIKGWGFALLILSHFS